MNEQEWQQTGVDVWLQQATEIESACGSISVGGLACDAGWLRDGGVDSRSTLARLVSFARRSLGWSVEELADKSEVEIEDVLGVETELARPPRARTVHQLAKTLNLPAGRLLELAGLAAPRADTQAAMLRFAARSEPTAMLTNEERVAFEEFVHALVMSSDDRE